MRTLCLFLATSVSLLAADPVSIHPLGADGQPLNLNFEAGTLKDWTATGTAFDKQPYKGAISKTRPFGEDKFSNHQGDFWIGGFEILRDDPKGTLTSAPFKAVQPWASFLIAGGDLKGTRVELVTKDDDKVFYTARGVNQENMTRAVVDLRKVAGRDIFIRIVDEESVGWGHVNFDDFVFHDAEPKFTGAIAPIARLTNDEVKYAGLPASEAAKAAILPEGFELKLFAAEPDIINPIAFTIDDRNRLWVVESHTYPIRAKDGAGKDKIIVFEDTKGTGHFDKRTVFAEGLNLVSGIAVGFGGVFVGSAPTLEFIPIADGDEPKPAGKAQVLLDGWGFGDTHETLNTFTWGPDGWLYGCHGVFTHSNVGKPGAADAERIPINAGFWRFHPTKHTFEVFAEGTSNSWGIDFDTNGQLFAEACVIPHLFHIIQGGRFNRQAGEHFEKHTYADIPTIADHRHYLGANPHGGNGKSDGAGGGHAHAGLMIYQNPSWPMEYQGQLFMGNIHGQRINMDIPVLSGSGFIGKHGADFINFDDKYSQVVNFLPDADGSVYFIDWYDKQQCHTTNRAAVDDTTGRIYKLIYKNQPTTKVNLAAKSDAELKALVTSANEWESRHSRRLLQERAATNGMPGVVADLEKKGIPIFQEPALEKVVREGSPHDAQRALWALHITGRLRESVTNECLTRTDSPYVTAWAIQCATENKSPSEATRAQFAKLASDSKSPIVRLYLASALQRLPIEQRAPIIEPLIAHEEDTKDFNLPLMDWYALEPVVGKNPALGATLLGKTKIPVLQEYIARRMASTAGQ